MVWKQFKEGREEGRGEYRQKDAKYAGAGKEEETYIHDLEKVMLNIYIHGYYVGCWESLTRENLLDMLCRWFTRSGAHADDQMQ